MCVTLVCARRSERGGGNVRKKEGKRLKEDRNIIEKEEKCEGG